MRSTSYPRLLTRRRCKTRGFDSSRSPARRSTTAPWRIPCCGTRCTASASCGAIWPSRLSGPPSRPWTGFPAASPSPCSLLRWPQGRGWHASVGRNASGCSAATPLRWACAARRIPCSWVHGRYRPGCHRQHGSCFGVHSIAGSSSPWLSPPCGDGQSGSPSRLCLDRCSARRSTPPTGASRCIRTGSLPFRGNGPSAAFGKQAFQCSSRRIPRQRPSPSSNSSRTLGLMQWCTRDQPVGAPLRSRAMPLQRAVHWACARCFYRVRTATDGTRTLACFGWTRRRFVRSSPQRRCSSTTVALGVRPKGLRPRSTNWCLRPPMTNSRTAPGWSGCNRLNGCPLTAPPRHPSVRAWKF